MTAPDRDRPPRVRPAVPGRLDPPAAAEPAGRQVTAATVAASAAAVPLRARAGVFVVVLTSVISALAVLSWLLAASELLILVSSGGGPEGMLTFAAISLLESTVPMALVLTALAALGWWWRYSTRTALVVAMVVIAGLVCWFVADNRAPGWVWDIGYRLTRPAALPPW